MDTSTDMLSTEYEILKSSTTELKKDIENKNQLIYDYKKHIAVATALEGDYLQEIEVLQSNGDAEVTELQSKIKELEDGIVSFRQSANVELLQKSDLIESLRSEFKGLIKEGSTYESKKRNSDHIDKDGERNFKLKEEVKILNETLAELETNIDNLRIRNSNLEQTSNSILLELDDAKQNYACKTQELIQTKNIIQNLQEESFLIKLELESLKNKPLDTEQKGNSLFAEVEDSRLKTEQNIKQIKKKYIDLKRDVCAKLKQMTSLRARNAELIEQLNFVKSYDEECEKVIEGYKMKVIAMESAIEQYKKAISKEQRFIGKDLPNSTIEFLNAVLKSKWNDVEKAKDDLNRISKKKLETFINIKDANTTMRKCRRNALLLKIKIEKLENAILEIQLQNSPTNIADIKYFENILEQKSNSVPNAVENILSCSTIEIRKKSTINGKCLLKQENQNKSLPLNSELNPEMLSSNAFEIKPAEKEIKNECASNYSEMKRNVIDMECSVERNNSISSQDEQSRKLVLDNTFESEALSSKSSKLKQSKAEIIKEELQLENESCTDRYLIEYQRNLNDTTINSKDMSETQLLKSSPNISTGLSVQTMSFSSFVKTEVYQEEETEVIDKTIKSEMLNSKSFQSQVDLIQPKSHKFSRDEIVKEELNLENESYEDNNSVNQSDPDESVIILENTPEMQSLKSTFHNISGPHTVQNMSPLNFIKMEVDKSKNNTASLYNSTESEIINSGSFEPNVSLTETKMLGSRVTDNIKEELQLVNRSNVDNNLVDSQSDLDESVIILENVSERHLLKSNRSHNISTAFPVQTTSINQNKTVFLGNLTESEILNSTSTGLTEPAELDINISKIIKDGPARKHNETNVEYEDDRDKSVIIVENLSGIQLLETTSHDISVKPSNLKFMNPGNHSDVNRSEHDTIKIRSLCKSTLFKKGIEPHLTSTAEFSISHNNFDVINNMDDKKQLLCKKYEVESIQPVQYSNSIPQETISYNNLNSAIKTKKELNNQEKNFEYEKSCVTNAGHTPAAHHKFKCRTGSAKDINKQILQLNAGHTPAIHQKWSVTKTPAGNSNVETPIESGKKLFKLKTSIPVPTKRK